MQYKLRCPNAVYRIRVQSITSLYVLNALLRSKIAFSRTMLKVKLVPEESGGWHTYVIVCDWLLVR